MIKDLKMQKILMLLLLLLFVACEKPNNMSLKNGDIVFQDSPSSQSKAVKLATHSNYSHVGIVYNKNGVSYVYEAIGPVISTPLDVWLNNGVGGHYVVKRLKDETLLTSAVLENMQTVAKSFDNKPYDLLFGWSDKKIYCSELVWKIYKRGANLELGKLKKLKEFDLSHPVVKRLLTQRYGKNIPLNEKVIDPQGVFDSDLLTTVYTN